MKDVHQANAGSSFAVLVSGGLDSAILLAESLKNHALVWPLYIRTGLAWEDSELRHLQQFLERIACPALRPLQVLELPVSDLYGKHWSLTGQNVPDAQSADEAVFLPGRNLLLLAKSMLWCHLHDVSELALAVLRGNPFPDATGSFFTACQDVVNRSVGGQVKVLHPYDKLSKREVMALGQGLPLELTFSCIRPVRHKHCGACN
ncbi:MAG TPA: 7-cyano-7-deazaguanine synthase, partial [Gemmataceae bacterium]|nr:7-cyano-7-deazaguanine synthase [Gemmataceae bacterium]